MSPLLSAKLTHQQLVNARLLNGSISNDPKLGLLHWPEGGLVPLSGCWQCQTPHCRSWPCGHWLVKSFKGAAVLKSHQFDFNGASFSPSRSHFWQWNELWSMPFLWSHLFQSLSQARGQVELWAWLSQDSLNQLAYPFITVGMALSPHRKGQGF